MRQHTSMHSMPVTRCVPLPCTRYKNGDRGQTYNFSRVFGEDTGQETFFQATAGPMVRQLLRAHTSSVLIAYGVSASGKTHTIEARPLLLARDCVLSPLRVLSSSGTWRWCSVVGHLPHRLDSGLCCAVVSARLT